MDSVVSPTLVIKQSSKTNLLLWNILWCWVVVVVNKKALVSDKLNVFHPVTGIENNFIDLIFVFFFSNI